MRRLAKVAAIPRNSCIYPEGSPDRKTRYLMQERRRLYQEIRRTSELYAASIRFCRQTKWRHDQALKDDVESYKQDLLNLRAKLNRVEYTMIDLGIK
jgi:hypothetical protein